MALARTPIFPSPRAVESVSAAIPAVDRERWLRDCFEVVELHVRPGGQGHGLGAGQLRDDRHVRAHDQSVGHAQRDGLRVDQVVDPHMPHPPGRDPQRIGADGVGVLVQHRQLDAGGFAAAVEQAQLVAAGELRLRPGAGGRDMAAGEDPDAVAQGFGGGHGCSSSRVRR
jgi:hypothetical protein